MSRRRSITVLRGFTKAKKLPTPGRVAGGGLRTVYYEDPDRVEIVEGKRVNGTRGSSSAEPDPGED